VDRRTSRLVMLAGLVVMIAIIAVVWWLQGR
jgi:hypothetical protein